MLRPHMKTDKMFYVHTRAFLGVFRWLFIFNIWQLQLKEVLSCHSKFFSPFIKDNNFVNEIVPPRTRSTRSNPETSLLVRPIASVVLLLKYRYTCHYYLNRI